LQIENDAKKSEHDHHEFHPMQASSFPKLSLQINEALLDPDKTSLDPKKAGVNASSE
jgi:hypothetical protein